MITHKLDKKIKSPIKTEFESYVTIAKISCITDIKIDIVILPIIENQFMDEIITTLKHKNNVKKITHLKITEKEQ